MATDLKSVAMDTSVDAVAATSAEAVEDAGARSSPKQPVEEKKGEDDGGEDAHAEMEPCLAAYARENCVVAIDGMRLCLDDGDGGGNDDCSSPQQQGGAGSGSNMRRLPHLLPIAEAVLAALAQKQRAERTAGADGLATL